MTRRVSNYRNKLRTARVRRAAVGIAAIHDLGQEKWVPELVTVVELSNGRSVRSRYYHREETPLDQLNVKRLEQLAADLRAAGVPYQVLHDFVVAAEVRR